MCSKCLTPISFLGQYHSRYNLCFRKYLLFLELTCPIHNYQSVSIQIWPFCIFRYLPFKIQLIVALCALWSSIITQSVSSRYKLLKFSCSLNVLSSYQSWYNLCRTLWSTIITQSVSSRYKLLKLSCSLNVLSSYQSRYNLCRTLWSTIITQSVSSMYKLFLNSLIPSWFQSRYNLCRSPWSRAIT